MIKLIYITMLIMMIIMATYAGGYGDATDASFSYEERLNHDMSNAVRIAPLNYRSSIYASKFTPSISGVINAATYPGVDPLWYHAELNQAARVHSVDMATNKCFSHNSCDGTSFSTRIKKYHNCGGIGENIAFGYGDALKANNAWLCDKSGTTCCADGQSCDGHRKNIMKNTYKSVGHGYHSSKYYTQDFSTCTPYSQTNQSIYSASHLINNDVSLETNSNIRFVLTHADSSATTTEAKVIVWGTDLTEKTYTMTREFGSANKGHYVYEATWSKEEQNCLSYYFEVTINSGAKKTRYPATSHLYTTGLGTCNKVSSYTGDDNNNNNNNNDNNNTNSGTTNTQMSMKLLLSITFTLVLFLSLFHS